jgi:thioredoxin 1
MSKIKHVGSKDFEDEVINSKLPVIVDMYADWCGPCRYFGPIFEKVSEEYEGKIKFVKVNVDDSPDIADKYNVKAIPTIMIFENGEPQKIFLENGQLEDRHLGALSEKELRKILDDYIKKQTYAKQSSRAHANF